VDAAEQECKGNNIDTERCSNLSIIEAHEGEQLPELVAGTEQVAALCAGRNKQQPYAGGTNDANHA
jgi:hypothetical protein